MKQQERLKQLAAQRAADLFLEHTRNNTVLQKPKAIAALAKEETTRFTQQHPEFQPQPQAALLYRNAFFRGYSLHLSEHGATSDEEDIKEVRYMRPDDL